MKKFLLCMWMLPLLFVSTAAASTPIIAVEPQSYTAEDIGLTFQVNVTLQDVTGLAGYEFRLGYNTTILTATSVTYGGIFGDTYFELGAEINDAAGWASYGCMENFGEPSFDGSGVLATVTFNTTELGFSTLHLYDTTIGDENAVAMDHNSTDGEVTVIPEFPLTVIAPLFLIATLAAVVLGKIIWPKRRREPFAAA